MSIGVESARVPNADQEQKRAALGHIKEAWAEAWAEGIDGDFLAQASLFCALTELVATYGEDATARFAEGLPRRIAAGEFSIVLSRQ
ncbi:hypothetical protein GJ689_16240 [Rhodoplanes serenus]|jgi:hypothetical protein|uniref:Uncharacterized protein n=1 Tax=Rhodoplanes serenus TaxID=200615 RepID=A0A327KA09_9BRAD|nr:hypothetical protein [Rhodoplanes serenus]MBI5113675.1 hypothetical protein [Rhodovulum sp.]MTW17757.1 hypothetical protein [Rhodoplanes serenus]RAI32138.1 hypothetical protein CH340_16410 [Rhodoplanes serenus]